VLGRVEEGAGFVCMVVVVVGCASMAGVLLEEWDAWLGSGAGFVCVVEVAVVGCASMAGVLLEDGDAWLGEAGVGDCFGVVELEVVTTFT